MTFWSYIPPRPLADFVELLWYYESYAPPHAQERILPMATMELVVPLGEDAGRPVISGPRSTPFVLDTSRPASMVGVHFKPGSAFAFIEGSSAELQNQHVSLDAIWGREAGRLQERMNECDTPAGKFRMLEQALMARGRQRLARHPAVHFALQVFRHCPRTPSIAQVTDQVGLSPRRFVEIFSQQVGVTPKLFCRIERFQLALRQLERRAAVDWTNLALGCGYYDQAHFNNEFRSFSGMTPTAYLRVRDEHFNHVPVAG